MYHVIYFIIIQYHFKVGLKKFPGETDETVGKYVLQLHMLEMLFPKSS